MTIRLRLTLWQTALVGTVLTGFAVLLYVIVSGQLVDRLDATLQLRSDDVSRVFISPRFTQSITFTSPTGETTTATATAPEVLDVASDSLYVQVVDGAGVVIAVSENAAEPIPVQLGIGAGSPPNRVYETVEYQGESLRVVKMQYPTRPGDPGTGSTLLVGMSRSSLLHDLRRLQLLLGGTVLAAISLTAAIGWFLAAKAMRPVDDITRVAHAIGQSAALNQHVPEPGQRDEIGRLAATFNEMIDRLGEAFATQRRFLADASHELRTPLTAIRTNVEGLLRGAGDDPVQRNETLRSVARETDRMGRLVTDLLLIARADDRAPVVRQPVQLDRLLLDVFQQQRPIAGQVKLEIGELEQVEVTGDPDQLRQVLLNLIDNALRHTPAGGTVTLDVARSGGSAELRVRDNGAGIPVEHLERIFDRFYRVDSARSRGGTGGAGLGLAICKEVATAHGGAIAVESEIGTGSTFTVRLPVSSE